MIPPVDDRWYHRPEGLRERVSAGGVVVRVAGGAVLAGLVRERNDDLVELDGYVLPKGGLEPGESIEAGARREIAEEAGLTAVTPLCELGVLERQSEKMVYWSVNHYWLFFTEQESGEILDKDHHFGLGWFALDALPPMFWPDERRLIESKRQLIYDAVIAHQNPRPRKKYFM